VRALGLDRQGRYPTRREVLRGAVGWTVASAVVGPLAWSRSALAAEPGGARVDPDEALRLLVEGNGRYVRGEMKRRDFAAEREALAAKQSPHSIILGCADSRVPPEIAFDQGRGDLFVVRIAGNFLAVEGLASIEYAVKYLGSSLVVVLGHSGCGAVGAAIKFAEEGAVLPGHLPDLVAELRPAVEAARKEAGDTLANAIRANVRLNVAEISSAGPIVAELVAAKKVRVVGAVYELTTGKVEFQT
jgi:carbonic anhydrase